MSPLRSKLTPPATVQSSTPNIPYHVEPCLFSLLLQAGETITAPISQVWTLNAHASPTQEVAEAALSLGPLLFFHNTSSLQSGKKTSAANLSRFVTSSSPGRGGNYHIWGAIYIKLPCTSQQLLPGVEREAGCTETIAFVHTIMKTRAQASSFSHKYGHYDLVGIAC